MKMAKIPNQLNKLPIAIPDIYKNPKASSCRIKHLV